MQSESFSPELADNQHDSLNEVFKRQQQAFAANPFIERSERIQQLKALKKALIKYQDDLAKAVSADFGCRSLDETKLGDILPTVMSIDHTIKHLAKWMKPEKRSVSMLFQPAQAALMHQPLGVVGIMSPWNYPVFLAFGPLVAAISAGNRVMIKPSEFCPYSNRVLNQILQQVFTSDEVCMIEGDADIATKFTQLPFDHLLFTGSTNIGKMVMAAAANNLTPVTLELGGKSPALIAPDVSADFAVERILFGKCFNAGQTCVAPDYILCPENKKDELITAFKQQFNTLYPDLSNGQFTSIINDSQYARLQSWIKDAENKGGQIIHLVENKDANQLPPRSMPLQLLTDVNSDMKIMQDEIFGPILPIVTYQTIEQANQIIHSYPRPLALYLFTMDKKLENKVLHQTHAGGVCINDTLSHVAQDDLPFGGIGDSGMGSYHAKEGFLTFSSSKPVFKRGRFNSAKMAFPPYNKLIHRLIYKWFLS